MAQSFLDAFTWRSVAVALVLGVLAALALKPIFHVQFAVLLGRTLAVSALLLLAFAAGRTWQLPGVPRWLAPVIAVMVTAPVATLLAYLPSLDGRLAAMLEHEGRISGFILITGTALVIAPLLALGALYRERDTQARAEQLAFQLERSTLEKQALDARLKLLNAQIEPHFLFNTLANVQELVESGSPRAAPVLRSLIAYLRAAMPKLHAGPSTLADEIVLVRAYLELMHMRMPDRLVYAVEVPRVARADRLSDDGAADAGRERHPPRHRPERGRRPDQRRRQRRRRRRHRRADRRHRHGRGPLGVGAAGHRAREPARPAARASTGPPPASSCTRTRRAACAPRSRLPGGDACRRR